MLGTLCAVKNAALTVDLTVSIDPTGCIGLSSDNLTCKCLPYNVGHAVNGLGCNVGVSRKNNVLNRGVVGSREINLLLSLIGNGETCRAAVSHLALCNGVDDDTEIAILPYDGLTHLLTNLLHDLNVNAYDLGAVIVLKGCEVCISLNVDRTAGRTTVTVVTGVRNKVTRAKCEYGAEAKCRCKNK